MAIEIIADTGGLLIQVRNADGNEYWVRRSRVQHIGGGVYETCSELRAKELRAAFARAEEKARKKKSGDSMQGPSRNIRTSTSGGRGCQL